MQNILIVLDVFSLNRKKLQAIQKLFLMFVLLINLILLHFVSFFKTGREKFFLLCRKIVYSSFTNVNVKYSTTSSLSSQCKYSIRSALQYTGMNFYNS